MKFNDTTASLGFVTSQTAHIETEVNQMVYPDIQYPFLTPVDTSAHPFVKTVTYYSGDQYGKAGWINGNTSDIPLADIETAQHETSVYMAAIGYGFGLEEINQAQMLSINLSSHKALSARRAYEEMVDRVLLRGDQEKGFHGLLEYPGLTIQAPLHGDWANATEDQIVADINSLLIGGSVATKQTSMADTLLLPYTKLQLLASTRLGDTSMTILEFVATKNVYTVSTGKQLTIRYVRGLETAGEGNTERMIAYRRSPDVLKAHIPMTHRFLAPFNKSALYTEVAGIFRLGGLDIRRPVEVRYLDGI